MFVPLPMRMLMVLSAIMTVVPTATLIAASHSFGTLVSCPLAASEAPCEWQGEGDNIVDGTQIAKELLLKHSPSPKSVLDDPSVVAKQAANVASHVQYIEEVYKHAREMNHEMTMKLGVNERHLYEDVVTMQMGHPLDAVLTNMRVAKEIHNERRQRHLQASSGANNNLRASLNWCSTDNPLGMSVCTAVKSQSLCGSCWAFAATDVIETAVALSANQSAQPLSPQQFLSCSNSTRTQTFNYCFAGKFPNAPAWLQSTMQWQSTNNGCNGGMTFIALMDAALNQYNLVRDVTWPYQESTGSVIPVTTQCLSFNKSQAAASIGGNGYLQGISQNACQDGTTDPTILLKRALQTNPLSVALNAQGSFKSYSSGVYTCPAIDGTNSIDHALLLVGYGTDAATGTPYWLLKNSYGTSWGMNGFLQLKMDTTGGINCGLNVFPIKVYGASNGPAQNVTLDGGGSLDFAGVQMSSWIYIGAAIGAATVLFTILGVIIARQRMSALREGSTLQ